MWTASLFYIYLSLSPYLPLIFPASVICIPHSHLYTHSFSDLVTALPLPLALSPSLTLLVAGWGVSQPGPAHPGSHGLQAESAAGITAGPAQQPGSQSASTRPAGPWPLHGEFLHWMNDVYRSEIFPKGTFWDGTVQLLHHNCRLCMLYN